MRLLRKQLCCPLPTMFFLHSSDPHSSPGLCLISFVCCSLFWMIVLIHQSSFSGGCFAVFTVTAKVGRNFSSWVVSHQWWEFALWRKLDLVAWFLLKSHSKKQLLFIKYLQINKVSLLTTALSLSLSLSWRGGGRHKCVYYPEPWQHGCCHDWLILSAHRRGWIRMGESWAEHDSKIKKNGSQVWLRSLCSS